MDSTLVLLAKALHQTSEHLGKTLTLACAEIDGNIRALMSLLALVSVCVLLIVAALFLFLVVLVKALAALIGSEALAAVVVASPFAVAAAVLTGLALRRMRTSGRDR
jgi:small-conductance mechanosensitive channel